MAPGDGCLEHLTSERGQRERYIELFSALQHESDVLEHPLYGKIGVEVATENKRGLVIDQTRLGGAVGEDVEHQFGVDAALGSQNHSFVKCLHDIAKNEVLSQLGLQPHA